MIEAEEKNKLIRKINEIKDDEVLQEVFRLLEVDFNDTVYELRDEQRKSINQAQHEIEQGKGIASEQADNEIDRWLKE